ncbi:LamG-like jellyroll fold domain-containing protein [Lacinutrix himadriensis]|uniref:LamG-like jellyroll fold domain-containing protein n=1 Tax=Lacinutrix himadriensis TaxID=641549 RepID=UPI0006E30046|nr:LamG-like jellyroll fold domain-containing protein [Lacinutrix himadriensis]
MKQKLLLLLFLANSLVLFANPEYQQNGYRWRNDNGNQTTATWKAATNTPSIVNFVDEQLRLRIEVKETYDGYGSFSTNPLFYRKNGGSWVAVSNNTSTDFYFVNSTYVEDGFSTTQQISSGGYSLGKFKSNSSSSSIYLTYLNRTEIEYSLAPSTLYDKTATYEFQISNLDDYAIYPTLNANPSFCETVKPTVSNITYILNQVASPLTATGTNLLWYTTASGGTGTATAPTPTTSSAGATSYWVTQTLNGCESLRQPLIVYVGAPATHLNFDGANDHVVLSNNVNNTLSGGTAITIEYWFKGTNVQSAVRFQTHGAYNDFITAGWGSGNPQFLVSTDGYNTGVELGDESVIEDNSWHHVACVWEKNEIFATYLDGVLQNSRVAANVNLPLLPENSGYLGIFGGTIEPLNGSLDDVRIWNVARTVEQINGSKNCELQGNETGLVAYYKFNQALDAENNTSETTLTDATSNGNNGTLTNFALSGATSNWLAGSPVTTPSAPTVTTPVVYTQGATASPLTATTGANGTGLLWYTTATGGTDSTTAPTPSTATVGSTSYWVAGTNANGCESERTEIVVTVDAPLPATHLNFDGVDDFIDCGNILPESYTKEAWISINAINSTSNIISGSDNFGQNAFWVPNGVLSAGHNGIWNAVDDSNVLSVNTWYHVAVSYDYATQTLKLYKDGILIDSNNNVPAPINGNEIHIGSFNDASNLFNGSIDDVRIWDVARTAEQINGSKDCELQGTEFGLAAYYKFNQGVDAGTNTSVTTLTDATANANDGTLTNFDLLGTISNWLAGSPVTTGSIIPSEATVSTPVVYNQGDTATPLTATTGANGTGLLWYTTETGGSGTSTASTPDTATIGTTSYWVSSTNANGCESERTEIVVEVNVIIPATHLNFDGVDDKVVLPNESNFDFTATFSIECWIKVNSFTQEWQTVISKGNEGPRIHRYGFSNFIAFGTGPGDDLASTIAVNDGNWHHIAATCDNGVKSLYVDGILQGTQTVSTPILTNNDPVLIGSQSDFYSPVRAFHGDIEEVRFWDVARTELEVNNSKNCELLGNETGLVAYYKFNQGNDAASNTSTTTLTDATANANDGTLTNFDLTGATSNWLAGSPVTTGSIIPSEASVTTPVTYYQGDAASPLTATTGANGTGLMWYTAETGGSGTATAPTPDTATIGTTSYWVSSSNTNGCESERSEIVVHVEETLGVSNNAILNTIRVFPNPTNGMLTISNALGTTMDVIVYDMNGRVLYNENYNQETNTLDVSHFSNGIYLLKMKTEFGEISKRVIKN